VTIAHQHDGEGGFGAFAFDSVQLLVFEQRDHQSPQLPVVLDEQHGLALRLRWPHESPPLPPSVSSPTKTPSLGSATSHRRRTAPCLELSEKIRERGRHGLLNRVSCTELPSDRVLNIACQRSTRNTNPLARR
jgi:hypothetical protein